LHGRRAMGDALQRSTMRPGLRNSLAPSRGAEMESQLSPRRRPIAVNLWSPAERESLYAALLGRLPLAALQELDGGRRCPFLLDVGLTPEQRAAIWQDVWDRRTLVRTAAAGTPRDDFLLRAAIAHRRSG